MVGWVRTVRVVSGSMAGEFYGPHYQLNCPQCARPIFAWVLPTPRPGGPLHLPKLWVPRCRVGGPAAAGRDDGRGSIAGRFGQGDLQTWDVVAYQTDPSNSTRAVKRVVACGGLAKVQIQRGDVLLAGHVQRKSLAQLQTMHVLVYDDRFRPEPSLGLPPRWQEADAGDAEDVCWTVTGKGFRCAATEATRRFERRLAGVSAMGLLATPLATPESGRADNRSSITMATTRIFPAQGVSIE